MTQSKVAALEMVASKSFRFALAELAVYIVDCDTGDIPAEVLAEIEQFKANPFLKNVLMREIREYLRDCATEEALARASALDLHVNADVLRQSDLNLPAG